MDTDEGALSSWAERIAAVDSSQESPLPKYQDGHHKKHWYHSKDLLGRRKSSGRLTQRRASLMLARTQTGRRWWKFTLRPWDDDEEQDWWFASTAIPLLAATLGPLANVFSIAALVTYWRMCLIVGISDLGPHAAAQCSTGGPLGPEVAGQPYEDPRWCYWLNVASLILGFVGNFFLLCNFTGRIRYIIALPVTILM